MGNRAWRWGGRIAILLFLASGSSAAQAVVTGNCANCHTMHNSQDGTPITPDGPLNNLLAGDCVGCHSSATAETLIALGGSIIPIVYNSVEPDKPLAGGNFHWVALGGSVNDAKGHNVYGISEPDSNLAAAPGKTPSTCGTTSCHATLAMADPPMGNHAYNGGCQGCHVFTAHHGNQPWYRYLKGHGVGDPGVPDPADTDYVEGIGDPDWEYTWSSVDHNYYQGSTAAYSDGAGLKTVKTVTAYCQGCHGQFHGPSSEASGGMGDASPWIRHPTDIALPESGEYEGYDPVNSYRVEAPVGWVNPAAPARSEAVVMCLSCHRAHGSPYADILRWDYTTMSAHNAGDAAGTGCFICHTAKD